MIDFELLRTYFDDEDTIKKYLLLFKELAPETLSKITDFINENNAEQISILAHSLKSQLQYLNADKASLLAYHIEQLCDINDEHNWEQIKLKVADLEKEVDEILREIEDKV